MSKRAAATEPATILLETVVVAKRRNQNEARRVAREHYPFVCCVICGLQLRTCLAVAHLDQNAGNNDPDNLALLCFTHHWMFDAGLYPIDAIRLMRSRWQETKGETDHRARMKNAGRKAARARRLSASARKAWTTRRSHAGD